MIEFKVGDKVSQSKCFSYEEVQQFSILSDDENPIHYDKDYAKKTIFKKPINQGFLSASLIGGLLGSKLPGEGTVYLSQSLFFKKPIYVNEFVKAEIEIISINLDKRIIRFCTVCYNEAGDIAIEGEALVTVIKLHD